MTEYNNDEEKPSLDEKLSSIKNYVAKDDVEQKIANMNWKLSDIQNPYEELEIPKIKEQTKRPSVNGIISKQQGKIKKVESIHNTALKTSISELTHKQNNAAKETKSFQQNFSQFSTLVEKQNHLTEDAQKVSAKFEKTQNYIEEMRKKFQ